jgi:magnesium transporter
MTEVIQAGRPDAGEGSRPSVCHLLDDDNARPIDLTPEAAQALLDSEQFFWLDIDQPTPEHLDVLQRTFRFHPLAIEDSQKFGQRSKIEEYDDFVFIVVYGASPDDDRLVEVHCFASERFLVTVHRDDAPAFADVRHRFAKRKEPITHPALLLYRIIDALVDSFFPVLESFNERIDVIEDQTFLRASDEELQEIFRLKRLLVGLRRAITPQRDMFAGLVGGVTTLPGMRPEDERYFRDIYDHLMRITDMIDTYRDLLTSSMDVYLSTVSNRLNVVMKQLAVIATVFLPLTFVTGFFGQNFPWLIGEMRGWERFVLLGVGSELVAVTALLVVFRRRGWF